MDGNRKYGNRCDGVETGNRGTGVTAWKQGYRCDGGETGNMGTGVMAWKHEIGVQV